MSTAYKLLPVLTLVSMFAPAHADTITFIDLTDTVSVQQSGTSRIVTPAPPVLFCASPESVNNTCFITVITTNLTAFPTSPQQTLYITEPDGLTLSDTLQLSPNIVNRSYDLTFRSDVDGVLLGPVGTPSIIENGQIQTAFTVSWSDGTFDTINFASDVEEVPEPFSPVLAGSGLLALAILFCKRLRAAPHGPHCQY